MPHNNNRFGSDTDSRYLKAKPPRSVGKRPAVARPAKIALKPPFKPTPKTYTSNVDLVIEDLKAIEKLRADRILLNRLLNSDEYDVGAMEPNEIKIYRQSFFNIYPELSDDIHILEIIAMANVRMDLLTKQITDCLIEFETTFGFKIIDDWER